MLGAMRVFVAGLITIAITIAVACRGSKPKAPPGPKLAVACTLDYARLACTATNHDTEYRVGCVNPYVGIKKTGALVSGESRACSQFIAPGKSETFNGLPGFRPGLVCGDLSGCIVKTFDEETTPPEQRVAALVAFIRELEAGATERGKDHPTLAECEEMRLAWLDRPDREGLRAVLVDRDLTAVFCVQLGRVEFDCLRAAKTAAAMNACPVTRLGG